MALESNRHRRRRVGDCAGPARIWNDREGDYKDGAPQDGIIEHVAALVEHLGLKRVTIVGISFGSNIACHLFWKLASALMDSSWSAAGRP